MADYSGTLNTLLFLAVAIPPATYFGYKLYKKIEQQKLERLEKLRKERLEWEAQERARYARRR